MLFFPLLLKPINIDNSFNNQAICEAIHLRTLILIKSSPYLSLPILFSPFGLTY